MSVTVTYSTIDHRYFMRRTKNEIIARIEEMQGRLFDFNERWSWLHKPKTDIVNEAMRLVLLQPPPPDPAETVMRAIMAELERQTETNPLEAYAAYGEADEFRLDGRFDMLSVAQAVLKSGVLTL